MSVTSTNGFCWRCHRCCRCRYHTVPGRKRRRRASEESAAKKNSLSRALSSIPELGAFARERLTLMVLVTNPAALDAVTRVSGGGWEREHRDGTRVGGAWFERSVARDGLDLCTYVRRNRSAGGALVIEQSVACDGLDLCMFGATDWPLRVCQSLHRIGFLPRARLPS